MTKKAVINYGYGVALLWGDFTAETVESVFHQHANQCFGIRKSISMCQIVSLEDTDMPEIFGCPHDQTAVILKHSGDTIVWNATGEKIRSEFD